MQNNPNTQKSISSNRSVLAHSEVTPAKKMGGLGTSTKSCSNHATQGFQPTHDSEKIKAYRKFTIKLKERAGEILFNPKDKKQNRVCGCGKWRIDKEMPVGVQFDALQGVARYHNLQYCGSVWVCPDCSYKISQERKKELAEAMKGMTPLIKSIEPMVQNLQGMMGQMGDGKEGLGSIMDLAKKFSSQSAQPK